MSYQEDSGERLREAACVGDLDLVSKLISKSDSDVNGKNQINGWSPLHWACKRNHLDVVRYLLQKGADKALKNNDGNIPAELTANTEIRALLEAQDMDYLESKLPITPNYLANPTFPYASINSPSKNFDNKPYHEVPNPNHGIPQELVLKARIANCEEKDFIEIELDRLNMSFECLLNLMCAELGVDKKLVAKIRKLPNTIVRKDKDVLRLTNFQEMELCLTNKAMSAASRIYNLGPARNHETILY